MILYCDTSAFVKFYFQEAYADVLSTHRQESEAVAISIVGYAEFLSAVNRKKRAGNLDLRGFGRVAKRFETDWSDLVRVDVTDELNQIVGRLLAEYPLRGFDGIHLASAVLLKDRLAENVVCFASLDDRQRQAAEQEGFCVLPELDAIP